MPLHGCGYWVEHTQHEDKSGYAVSLLEQDGRCLSCLMCTNFVDLQIAALNRVAASHGGRVTAHNKTLCADTLCRPNWTLHKTPNSLCSTCSNAEGLRNSASLSPPQKRCPPVLNHCCSRVLPSLLCSSWCPIHQSNHHSPQRGPDRCQVEHDASNDQSQEPMPCKVLRTKVARWYGMTLLYLGCLCSGSEHVALNDTSILH